MIRRKRPSASWAELLHSFMPEGAKLLKWIQFRRFLPFMLTSPATELHHMKSSAPSLALDISAEDRIMRVLRQLQCMHQSFSRTTMQEAFCMKGPSFRREGGRAKAS